MHILIYSLIAVIIVSLISLIGVFFLFFKHKTMQNVLFYLVSFAAGGLIGGALLHLLPEAIEEFGTKINISYIFVFFLIGILVFFLLERFLHWHHCHKYQCKAHMFHYMILLGDAFHNFVDGLVIAASFFVNIGIGMITTLAVILHEIPQEIGDFAVLVFGGFSKTKALLYNFLSALTAIIGVVIGYFLFTKIESFTVFLLPFTAGGFIYIAVGDLMPQLHKEEKISKSMLQLVMLILGILLMFLLRMV